MTRSHTGNGSPEARPRLLDLFCGAGGAAMGYSRAGFEVTGVDHHPQPNYPFRFVQEDALDVLRDVLSRWTIQFDAIHASPPCQRWTRAQRHRKNSESHADLITPLRVLLERTGFPYVIENVEGAPLNDPLLLCGSMFDMDVQYHRLFETNWPLGLPVWGCRHKIWAPHRYPGTPQGTGKNPGAMVVNRMASGVTHEMLAGALGIDWIPATGKRPTKALSEAIPPAYTEWIGAWLLKHIQDQRAA